MLVTGADLGGGGPGGPGPPPRPPLLMPKFLLPLRLCNTMSAKSRLGPPLHKSWIRTWVIKMLAGVTPKMYLSEHRFN